MICNSNFQQILSDLQRGFEKIVLVWFPDKHERQLDCEKSKAYRKIVRMLDKDMSEAFEEDNRERALKLWTILTESMKIITAFPEQTEADTERVKALYTAYEKEYYKDDSEVV